MVGGKGVDCSSLVLLSFDKYLDKKDIFIHFPEVLHYTATSHIISRTDLSRDFGLGREVGTKFPHDFGVTHPGHLFLRRSVILLHKLGKWSELCVGRGAVLPRRCLQHQLSFTQRTDESLGVQRLGVTSNRVFAPGTLIGELVVDLIGVTSGDHR